MTRIIFFLLVLFSGTSSAAPEWIWQDKFTSKEVAELKQWIRNTETGLQRLFGPIPFAYRVYFHLSPDAQEPVPWANTSKHHGRSVIFYVDPTYSHTSFRQDWTAPHEMSHLLFPYLGDEGRWFAEGIASYLQYQVMYANETLTWSWITDKLQERFQYARNQSVPGKLSITELSLVVRDLQAWVRLYWGGAAYFMQADKQLYETRELRLIDVIRKYLHCCSGNRKMQVQAIIEKFDQLSDSNIFSDTYRQTVLRPGFPETTEALAWLRRHPPGLLD